MTTGDTGRLTSDVKENVTIVVKDVVATAFGSCVRESVDDTLSLATESVDTLSLAKVVGCCVVTVVRDSVASLVISSVVEACGG